MKKNIIIGLASLAFCSCSVSVKDPVKVNSLPQIYPDYANVTVPVNIAPLNFQLRDEPDAICVFANDEEIYDGSGNDVQFDMGDWKDLLAANIGKSIKVRVDAEYDGKWREYKEFMWTVSNDSIDPYITYRLIEPDYEVYNNLVLQERCIEDFSTKNFCDHGVVGNKCMNCHTYASQDPSSSMFYVRGEGGGAILNMDGKLQKLNLKREGMVSGSVYFGFSPSKRFIVFSTNVIIPAFHSAGSKRMEVFDTVSDVYVADLQDNKFIESPLLSDSMQVETFPTFSPDGKYIYYCTAARIDSVEALKSQKYSLCRVAFNEETGVIGTEVDTVYSASVQGKSVCHPRISPDGRYLVFTVADYGTFPIWHRESDLCMIDMKTSKVIPCTVINSPLSDTYHSWSSNSRWMVFASKRGDGLYGKPYFAHIDANGKWSKPFVLPQEDPEFYDDCLKSFNAPEMGKGPLPFNVDDVQNALEKDAVDFR